MSHPSRKLLPQRQLATLIAGLVGVHGGFILTTTLLDQFAILHGPHLDEISIDVPLLIGVSLLYLSSRLMRRKQRAWQVAVLAYMFILGLGVASVLHYGWRHQLDWDSVLRSIGLPLAIVGLLLASRQEFVVRSDLMVFRSSVKFTAIVLIFALLYGVTGFLLLDESDFHQDISAAEAFHRTIDQFDLTTTHPLQPYTRRARIFQDSLSVVSIATAAYVVVSFFSPLRARFGDQSHNRRRLEAILTRYGGPSEDFFKLWPHDKLYFFNASESAGLALKVSSGVALVLGDPVGEPKAVPGLLKAFERQCYVNDWLPGLVHVEPRLRKTYESQGYSLQKIGEEAIVNIAHFQQVVESNKYFRNIRNRFNKAGFVCELLQPPHHPDILKRLRAVSDEWLEKPGRTERGYVMGYFSENYLQLCPLLVARDAAGTIQAFLNQLPAQFDSQEATYDLLRHAKDSPSNINDFLLVNFIQEMQAAGYQRVNMGLSPLVGIGDQPDKTLLDNFLYFAYANGDRFYSFSGLHRFKDKYQPEWSDRYIGYKSGLVGFTRTMNALMRAMQVKDKQMR